MNKKVNVYPTLPILTITPNITSVVYGVELGFGEIKQCLFRHARVEEILADGTKVQLDLNNLSSDNEAIVLAERNSKEAKIRSQEGTRLALEKALKKIDSLNETIREKDIEISQLTVKLAASNEDLSKAEEENKTLNSLLAETDKKEKKDK